MIIFPAIDLRGGRCVRLRQGRPELETVFSADPLQTARHWVSEGARWLHVVDLDATLGNAAAGNDAIVAAICQAAGVPVQFGGGLRSPEAIDKAFARGVQRIVIGSAAVSNPALVESALARFGAQAVAVGIDSRSGRVTVRGWQETTEIDAVALALQMKALGVARIITTDVARDGMLSGPNLDLLRRLAETSGLRVIASGGISTLNDLASLAAIPGIEGAITGQALYTGAFALPEALAAAGGSKPPATNMEAG